MHACNNTKHKAHLRLLSVISFAGIWSQSKVNSNFDMMENQRAKVVDELTGRHYYCTATATISAQQCRDLVLWALDPYYI